jgi:hypothetical protein
MNCGCFRNRFGRSDVVIRGGFSVRTLVESEVDKAGHFSSMIAPTPGGYGVEKRCIAATGVFIYQERSPGVPYLLRHP